jgi:hypothetical protein
VIVKEIIESEDISESAIITIAKIAMMAPSDFDSSSKFEPPPFRRIQIFLAQQNKRIKVLFREECKKNSDKNEQRLRYLCPE